MRSLSLTLVLLFSGCRGPQDVECIDDTSCDRFAGGSCRLSLQGHHWCAYPDGGCPDGYRFSDLDVGDGVSGQCSGCRDGDDCGAATPYCVAGACVVCDANEACSARAPICDEGTHECRRCSIDRECGSGVCDPTVGSCADELSILYVSPGGTTIDPCTRQAPCSLAQAFSRVDPAHPYVEMTPGIYSVGATLQGRSATLVGDNATLRVTDLSGAIEVTGQGTLATRHLKLLTGAGAFSGLSCDGNSSLEVFDLEAMGPAITASACRSLQVSASTFIDGAIYFIDGGLVDAGVIIDRTRFLGSGPSVSGGSFYAIITNSLIVADQFALTLRSIYNGSPSVETRIEHNTIVGGIVDCTNPATPGRPRRFRNNLFIDQTAPLPDATSCTYHYNLTMPPDFTLGGGVGNITGDPRFVDRAGGDYHLQAGSPAIDAAEPTSIEDHDLDDKPRPQGGRSDIGAFERSP